MRIRHALIVVGVAVLTGCTTTSRGEPVPAATVETTTEYSTVPSSSGVQDLPFAGAPRADNPLDTARFQQDPCQGLTPDQTQKLNVPPAGKPRDMPLGNACEWDNSDTGGRATIHFLDKEPRGLSAEYQANEDGKWVYFEKLSPID